MAVFGKIFGFLSLLGFGYLVGKWIEARHFKDMDEREAATQDLPVSMSKKLPAEARRCFVVSRSMVVSDDYFKRMIAALKSVFGGRLSSYETLLERARREATLRLKEDALRGGAQGIAHFRIESCQLFAEGQQDSLGAIHITAYGTAYSTSGQAT